MPQTYEIDLRYTDRENGDVRMIVTFENKIEVYSAHPDGREEWVGHLENQGVNFTRRAIGAIEREIKRFPISRSSLSWLRALEATELLRIWHSAGAI